MSHFKFLMRDDYKEPREQLVRSGGTIDVYTKYVDGYAYRSYDRLHQMHVKKFWKPVGPVEQYQKPVTTAMDIGWTIHDPELQGACWTKTHRNYKLKYGDATKFLNEALLKDPMYFWKAD